MRLSPQRPESSPLVELRARQLRSRLTPSEAQLWEQIRRRQLGVQFRRQVPIGGFIVDFLAPKERLILEVDGPYHQQRQRADARRDRKLARLGYRILRLEAELVLRQMPGVLKRILAAVKREQ
jgi:very-short-patch-repair endonuclease